MIFPIGDTQVERGFKPIFAYSFIAMNIAMFLVQLSVQGNLVCELSVIPQNIRNGSDFHTLFSSMFMHGGFMHIIGNMLFLWVFGDNIEATVGSFKFVLFYILGGLIASFFHILIDGSVDVANCCNPCVSCTDETMKACASLTPSLGASGAISAVMGAYMIMFPKSKIKILVIFLFKSFFMNAWIFLALWFGQQLLAGVGGTMGVAGIGGVAWWAHIGGFAIGILAGFYFKTCMYKGQNKIENINNGEYI